ncbi:dUTP diphosphatase [Leptotrichia trevisanii]|uniref:dUTP diphosphatase n=1 Tax=Leptotrichia trevisanii TaxID=109328 RepID=UPI0026F2213A|nr:dUTP diphosphatase [Leptotrichia trevisanii]
MINEKIGNNIKKWRKLKKLTQQELGLLIDKNVKSIQRYETGVNPIPIDVLSNIAKALNIEIEDLISGIEENIKEKPLKKFDIEELLKRQAMLDKKFDGKKTTKVRTAKGIQVALITEIGELVQELKSEWNYGKNSTEKFNKSKVLEELSDVLHFYLSYINARDEETKGRTVPFLDETLVEYNREVLSVKSLEDILITLSDFRILNENKVLGGILAISEYVGVTEEGFLQVHHEKWLKNMNERTKESY